MEEKQKIITKNQLLMIEGLLALRLEVRKQFRYIEEALAEILQEPEDGEDYWGLVSDYMWEDGGAKQLLKNLDIKVKWKNKK